MKQKNIISKKLTGLDGCFTAEQLLYAVKYKYHCHLVVDVVYKLPVAKILNMKSLKTIVLRIWLRRVTKGNEMCFILFFCNFS